MKPLELTVYPLRDKVGRNARPGFIVGKRAVSVAEARRMMTAKRFTDAELAAEHWSYCTGWYAAVRADDDYEGGMWSRELQRRAVILERFASLPHYDEVSL